MDVGKHPTKKITACHGSKAHAMPALAVGGKLTKRVHGSLECRGGWSMSGMGWYVIAASRDVTQRLPRWRMTRPLKRLMDSYAFASQLEGKGVALTPFINHQRNDTMTRKDPDLATMSITGMLIILVLAVVFGQCTKPKQAHGEIIEAIKP